MRFLIFILCSVGLMGCQSALDKQGYAYDPFEPTNRAMFAFNQQLDSVVIKPVATVYDTIMPDIAQTGVRNVTSNLDDVGSFINSLLQGKFHQSLRLFTRILSNTVFGLGGLIDVATPMNNPKISTDFGATLAHYGVESGAFLMLPVIGPTTIRDGVGQAVDALAYPLSYSHKRPLRIAAVGAEKIQQRADLLGREGLLEESPDPYATMRDVWLQHRFGQLGFVIEEPDFEDENSNADQNQSALPSQGGQ